MIIIYSESCAMNKIRCLPHPVPPIGVRRGLIYIDKMTHDNVEPYDTYWNSFLPAFFDRMSLQMRKNMTSIVEPYGLTHAHAIYLIALRLQDGQTMVGLSHFLDMDTANTNRVIKILREKELVCDDRKTENNKKYRIFLTESGRDLADKVMNGVSELNESYFANIPRENILIMRNTLIQVLNNMNLNIDDYMHSKYDNPFYTLLHIVPQSDDAYEAMPARVGGRKKRTTN